MKTKIYQYLLMVGTIFAIPFITACSDDDGPKPETQGVVDFKEFARINSFIDIDIPGDADWQVIAYPLWAAPMQEQGKGDTLLELFVETNEDEADRNDTLTVATTDGKIYRYALKQMGTLRDPDNGAMLSESNNSKTNGVGFTLNVLDNSYATLSKYMVRATSPVNFSKLVKELKKLGEEEAFYIEDRHYSYTENIIGNSTEDVACQLAVNGGITLGLDAFNATVTGAFDKNSTDSTQNSYAMQQIRHIILARYIRSGILRYFGEKGIDVWKTTMSEDLNALRTATKEEDIKNIVKHLVDTYGTHIITYAAMGGELRVAMQMKRTSQTSDMDIHGAINLSSKIINGDGNVNISVDEQAISNNTSISLKTYGGTNAFTPNAGMTFIQFQQEIKTNIKTWADGIESKPALIDIETVPLWDIMPTVASRNVMRKYIMVDLQRSKFGDDFTPALYKVSGFDVSSEVAGEGSISLPRIDQVVKAERKIVKELSEDKLSTIIYSGAHGKVNENCGFFVGSDKLKPAKVRKAANGKITVEPLEGLSTGAIEEVYIDATGDVTLKPKSFSDLYDPVTMSWTNK